MGTSTPTAYAYARSGAAIVSLRRTHRRHWKVRQEQRIFTSRESMEEIEWYISQK